MGKLTVKDEMQYYKYIAEIGKIDAGKSKNYDIVVEYAEWMNKLISKYFDISKDEILNMDLEEKKIKEEEITAILKTGKKNLKPSLQQTKNI